MDIAKAIADHLGKELEIRNMDFDGALWLFKTVPLISWQQAYL